VDGLVLVGVRSSALSALLIKEGGCSDILVGRSLKTELIEHVSSGFLAVVGVTVGFALVVTVVRP
jgi:hypothetical protein